jgi:class 3 adenylate cyclase/pimeloyl-ACP methyl ester carboxylesterase
MADREVRYCTTEDGVTIAYAVSGKGGPWLLHTTNMQSATLQYDHIPGRREWTGALEQHFRLVQYDPRGTGLSQRDVEDLSFEALILDLEAVADAAGADKAVVFGFIAGSFVAVWYAAAHPERVSHLALWLPPEVRWDSPQTRAGAQLAISDWETFTEYFAHQALGWDRGEQSNAYAKAMRETVSRETWLRFMGQWMNEWSSRQDEMYEPASRVQAPTLCMQREDYEFYARYAAPIAGATTRMFPGKGIVPYFGGGLDIVQAIVDFVGEPASGNADEQTRASTDSSSGTAIILFLDIAGSTELTSKLGDAAYREQERALDASLRTAIREAGGSPVDGKVLGDGVMATFASAKDAIDAALRCEELGRHAGLPLHLGIHAGDVLREGQNVHGGAVQVAARIADASGAGEVLVSQTVRDLARTSAGVSFEDRGERELKGVSEPMRVFAVRGG